MNHRRPTTFDRFHYGVCYYPEHWDDATRREDAARMAAAGVTVVRLGEFSWDLFEPEEGKFDFSFYDRVLPELHRHGISVIMGTPTAAAPRWLTVKHPGIHRVDAKGVAQVHGSRQHLCTGNAVFRDYSKRITAAMAAHFKSAPSVMGWQTDNEFNCHFAECHCASCQTGFATWTKARYGTIAALNTAWGNAFWAQTLNDFSQVTTPRDQLPTWQNPSARLDYLRFVADRVADFQHDQVKLLRAADPRWFIMHNGTFWGIDYHGRFTTDLDVLGVDLYPGFAAPADKARWHAWACDRTRAYGGNFVVPEQQAGPGGQGNYLHSTLEPGEMRQQVYTSIGRGCDQLLHFRWRSCRFGAEEYWCGILDHDNVPRRRYAELSRIGNELKRVGPAVLGTYVHIDCAVASVPLEVNAADGVISHGLPGPERMGETVHQALLEGKYAVGCVHPADDLAGLKLYVIPHWAAFDPAWIPGLTRWVEAGGTLVLGARCGQRRLDNNHVTDQTFPSVFRPLAGITVEEYQRLNTGHIPTTFALDGATIAADQWCEQLVCTTATSLATWTSRFFAGSPAVTVNRVGAGRVVYVGTYLMAPVIRALLPMLSALAGLTPQVPGVPDVVEVVQRTDGKRTLWFLINHGDVAATVPMAPAGTDLVTGTVRSAGPLTLDPWGVAVLQP